MPPFRDRAGPDLEPLPPPVGDLWERIVAGLRDPRPRRSARRQMGAVVRARPDYVARMVERSRRYLYHIVTEVSARKMPMEIALLPMVESAYNPSRCPRAARRASGSSFRRPASTTDSTQNFWFDSRRDVVAATDKALEYLQKLHDEFDDWQLALAGYNWGEGNVARADREEQSKGLPGDYAALSMPAETRNYLPKLQAVKNIVRDPGEVRPRARRHSRTRRSSRS